MVFRREKQVGRRTPVAACRALERGAYCKKENSIFTASLALPNEEDRHLGQHYTPGPPHLQGDINKMPAQSIKERAHKAGIGKLARTQADNKCASRTAQMKPILPRF